MLLSPKKNAKNRYAKMIKEPMDLGTIRQRMENFEYIAEDGGDDAIEGAKRFVNDLLLVFDNCQTFNRPGSGLYLLAAQMLEFCRVDLLGSYGDGKIRKQAVYGKKTSATPHSKSTSSSLTKDFSVSHWHDFNIRFQSKDEDIVEEKEEQEQEKDPRLKLIETFSNALQLQGDLNPNLRLQMLKYLCDMSCVTSFARKALRRRREQREEIYSKSRDSCKSALDDAKQKHGGSLGNIKSDTVLALKRLSHAHQRRADATRESLRLAFIGTDSKGSKYYWHGANNVRVFEKSNPIRVQVSEHGSVLIQNSTNSTDEENGKRWSRVSDFHTANAETHPIHAVLKSLDHDKDKKLIFVLERIRQHAEFCHRR